MDFDIDLIGCFNIISSFFTLNTNERSRSHKCCFRFCQIIAIFCELLRAVKYLIFSDVRSAKFSRVKFSTIQQRVDHLIQQLSIQCYPAFFFRFEYAPNYSHARTLRLSNFQSKRVIIAPGNCNTNAFTPLSV